MTRRHEKLYFYQLSIEYVAWVYWTVKQMGYKGQAFVAEPANDLVFVAERGSVSSYGKGKSG